MQLSAGAVMDLGGIHQTVASLSDRPRGRGHRDQYASGGHAHLAAHRRLDHLQRRHPNGASQTSLALNGAGATQVLTGSNTYSGVTTVSGGTLQLGSGGNAGSINDTGAVVTGADGILAFNHSDNVVFPAPISGSGGVQQMGPGVLSFGMPATYTGPTVITGGTLQASTYNFESVVPGVVAHYTFNQPTGPISDWQVMPNVSRDRLCDVQPAGVATL